MPDLFIPLLFILLTACAGNPEQENQVIIKNEHQIKSKLRHNLPNELNRTSNVNNTIFQEVTKTYFHQPLFGQKLYLSDLNQDGDIDIVTLEEKYSVPKVFLFDRKSKAYYPSLNNFFPIGLHASFLNFDYFNEDKKEDVLVGQFYLGVDFSVPQSQLYLRKDKNFEFFDQLFESPKPHVGGALIDFDLDGKLDFFQVFWIQKQGVKQGFFPPEFKLTNGKSIQVNYQNKFIENNGVPSWSAEICDINNDNKLDLLIANTSGHQDFVFTNQSIGDSLVFKGNDQIYAPLMADHNGYNQLLGNSNNFGFLCEDFNNDGLLDVISFGEKRELQDLTRDPIRIHLQQKLRSIKYPFLSSEFPIQLKNYSIKNIVPIDFDNDGDVDLLFENSGFPPRSRLMLFENINGTFKNVSEISGVDIINPSGTISYDINHDGLPDILIGQSTIRMENLEGNVGVFENKLKTPNNSVKLYFWGLQSNRSAVGAIVTLTSKNHRQKKIVNYMRGGLPSQGDKYIHFGLGNETEFNLDVIWPNKKRTRKSYRGKIKPGEKQIELTLCENGIALIGRKICLP